MVSILKSLQSLFATLMSDLPEGLRVVLDFLWRSRWFIVGGYVLLMVYTVVLKVLPFLMWSWVLKQIVGSLFSL